MDLGYPDGAKDVDPEARVGLLEGAVAVGAQDALDLRGRRLDAAAAQPLALGDVGHAVALLVHGQVAHVAEEDGIAVVAFAVQADAAEGVLCRRLVQPRRVR